MENKRQIGTKYERQAAAFLIEQGYEILEYNYRNRSGEIDLIARDQEYLCFVEVKYRTSRKNGFGAEAVNFYKQQNIIQVAQYYMMTHGYNEWTACRFDVVSIDGTDMVLYKNAFEGK